MIAMSSQEAARRRDLSEGSQVMVTAHKAEARRLTALDENRKRVAAALADGAQPVNYGLDLDDREAAFLVYLNDRNPPDALAWELTAIDNRPPTAAERLRFETLLEELLAEFGDVYEAIVARARS